MWFSVKLNGKKIDSVYQSGRTDTEEVRRSLIDHDGYDSRIEVKKERKLNKSGSKKL